MNSKIILLLATIVVIVVYAITLKLIKRSENISIWKFIGGILVALTILMRLMIYENDSLYQILYLAYGLAFGFFLAVCKEGINRRQNDKKR